MNNLINLFKNIEWFSKLLIGFFGALIATIWWFFSAYNNFKIKNDEIYSNLKTTQQMALKSVIWNEKIPVVERANACDLYLSSGYNSLTKKECEKIISKIDLK